MIALLLLIIIVILLWKPITWLILVSASELLTPKWATCAFCHKKRTEYSIHGDTPVIGTDLDYGENGKPICFKCAKQRNLEIR